VPFGRSILLAAAQSDALNRFATKSPVVKRATRKFMPGEKPEDALDAGARKLPAHVSIKPTQLGLDQSETKCTEHCLALAARAESTGSALWIDMEDHTYVDRTLALYETIKAKHPSSGLAMQTYLYRTPKDLERLMPLQPIVRLVKGAYAEPESVAYPRKSDTDQAFYDLAVTMLEGAKTGSCKPILGTHDEGLIARIAAKAEQLGVAKGKYEVHMLYGIGDNAQARLRREGQAVTTLISYGDAWYRWYMRRLAERPANVLFVVKSMFG
jgi:proline dehydrogenase